MKRVYIASPYTLGDVAVNVRRQMECADALIDLGFAPFVPLYSHFQHMYSPKNWDVWLEQDLEWVKVCNVLLRLSGESAGADIEVKTAKENNIPVVYSIEELAEKFGEAINFKKMT